MEPKVYDLNEYSLEVKDGKAVLKRKGGKVPQGVKPGDVLKNNLGDIVIYEGTNEKGGIITYCSYNVGEKIFTDRSIAYFFYAEIYDYASEEEKAMLFAEIEKRGYVWDAEKKELRKKRWRAKKGEEYWHAEFGQGITRAFSSVEMGREVDDFRYEQGNYYGTKEGVLRDIEEVERNKKEK